MRVGIVIVLYLLVKVVPIEIVLVLQIILVKVVDKRIVLVILLATAAVTTIPPMMHDGTLVALIRTGDTPSPYLANLGHDRILGLPQPAPIVPWIMVPFVRRKESKILIDDNKVKDGKNKTKGIIAA